MTGDVINLRKFRKDKLRSEREKEADANRAKFGMTKAEKNKTQAEKSLTIRQLDGAHLTNKKDPSE